MSASPPELPEPNYSLHRTGSDHSRFVGRLQLQLLQHYGLRPTDDVLEIGCGVGRLAFELAPVLTEGSYRGFDIGQDAIEWLQANYTSRRPDFRFDLVPVANARYRPDGAPAADAAFPYDDDSFDLACSFSVFTHMRLPEISHYLAELARVLRPDGLALMTFFLLHDHDHEPAVLGRPLLPFEEGCLTTSLDLPEKALAYDHQLMDRVVAQAGLVVVDRLEGGWRPSYRTPPAFEFPKDVLALRPA